MANKSQKNVSLLIFTIVVLLSLILDLITKHYTVGINSEFIKNFIKFYYTENTGGAWSIFSNSTLFLTIFSATASILLIIFLYLSKNNSKSFHIAIGFIIGGALGNLFDRICFGYVRDFIKLEFINFPIFNLADSFLTVGIVLLCVYYFIELLKDLKKKKEKGD